MIEIENLSKSFGPKRAVDDVSFSVGRGDVLGFLGPNGAGKSTTMRMITGFIPPSSGSVRVGGHNVQDVPIPAKRLIGYLPENAPGYADMTVHGFLAFVAELRGLGGRARRQAIARVAELCFLEPVLYQTIETLSKGYKHRTCLAQALIHDPDILILDEPTDGLDPNQKHEVRNLIRRMGENKAIIFSTHILEEVEATCSRVIIIDRGRIVANGTPAELKQRSEYAGAVRLCVANGVASAITATLGRHPGVDAIETLEQDANRVCVRVRPQRAAAGSAFARELGALAVREQWAVEELHTEEGRLDDVFRAITLSDTQTEARQ
jgi:ABC-2 type transport system ATP-binding protein